jgi:SRSO17 transposase
MPAIVEFPTVVQDLLAEYGDLFANAPERRHFAEYHTDLFVAERKTVSGINREFAVTTDQSCLNRWITEVAWDEQALNQRRLDLLQRDTSTRYTKNGAIAIDNTLIDHDGKLIEDAG